MKATETEIIRHSLGLDHSKKPDRNYFFAGPGHEDYPLLEKMVVEGKLVRRLDRLNQMDISYIYQVTPDGRKCIGTEAEES